MCLQFDSIEEPYLLQKAEEWQLSFKNKFSSRTVVVCSYAHSHICDHLSENPHSSHKHELVYWIKETLRIIYEILHATGKYLQGLMGPAISEGNFKSTKTMHTVTSYSFKYGIDFSCHTVQ